jgi:glycine dehydrogenase
MYAVYHGPKGLQGIAHRVHIAAIVLAKALRDAGNTLENKLFFDTLRVSPSMAPSEIRQNAKHKEINLRYFPDGSVSEVLVCLSNYGIECCYQSFSVSIPVNRLESLWTKR